jgi:hypothetical protein
MALAELRLNLQLIISWCHLYDFEVALLIDTEPWHIISALVIWCHLANGFGITGMNRKRKFQSVPTLSGLIKEYWNSAARRIGKGPILYTFE